MDNYKAYVKRHLVRHHIYFKAEFLYVQVKLKYVGILCNGSNTT